MRLILILGYYMGGPDDPLMPIMDFLKPLGWLFMICLIIYGIFLKDHIKKER